MTFNDLILNDDYYLWMLMILANDGLCRFMGIIFSVLKTFLALTAMVLRLVSTCTCVYKKTGIASEQQCMHCTYIVKTYILKSQSYIPYFHDQAPRVQFRHTVFAARVATIRRQH